MCIRDRSSINRLVLWFIPDTGITAEHLLTDWYTNIKISNYMGGMIPDRAWFTGLIKTRQVYWLWPKLNWQNLTSPFSFSIKQRNVSMLTLYGVIWLQTQEQ